jgi:hypothetical protein
MRSGHLTLQDVSSITPHESSQTWPIPFVQLLSSAKRYHLAYEVDTSQLADRCATQVQTLHRNIFCCGHHTRSIPVDKERAKGRTAVARNNCYVDSCQILRNLSGPNNFEPRYFLSNSVYVCDLAYTQKQILGMEGDILSQCQFNILQPSGLTYFDIINAEIKLSPKEYFLGRYILEITIF